MKKILTTIAFITMMFTMFATITVNAEDLAYCEDNAKLVASERTDIYALDYYKNKWILKDPEYADLVKLSNSITAGITDDYAKVKAIHDWVANNIWYDYDYIFDESLPVYVYPLEVLQYKKTVCDGYARLTVALAQAAGFPAKRIVGKFVGGITVKDGSHAWTEVWVKGRWLFLDATQDSGNGYSEGQYSEQIPCGSKYFDLTLERYSRNYIIDSDEFKALDADVWNGSLYFYDSTTETVLKDIKNFPLNGLITSTYGFDINDLYTDYNCTEHFKLNTVKVDSLNCALFVKKSVKSYTVKYNSNSGTTVKTVTVKANSIIAKPVAPTRTGYKFVGWFKDSKCTQAWNFATNNVAAITTLYAGWIK